MNSYNTTLKYLYGLQGRGMKFGLRNIKALLKSVENPEQKFQSIHIAGTNGKGSTASFLASIFMEAGYKTALYTSPHLIRFTERVRINGQEISEARLIEYAQLLRPMVEEVHATFFEATTCIAFQYFGDEGVDIAIVEAGLGGRFDSTNVLRPLVSVITNVSFDHMEYLGTTLKRIAREKAGIIKRNVPCVTASTNCEVVATLRGVAEQKGVNFIQVDDAVEIKTIDSLKEQLVLNLHSDRFDIKNVKLGLPGIHQAANAATSVSAVSIMMRNQAHAWRYAKLTDEALKRGLEDVRKNAGIRGRLETIGKQFILDVAHNPEGMKTLAGAFSLGRKSEVIAVFGVMKDKDFEEMLKILCSISKHVVAVQPQTPRALQSSEIVSRIRHLGMSATNGKSVRNGIVAAKRLAGSRGRILITGSHYVVGEALKILEPN